MEQTTGMILALACALGIGWIARDLVMGIIKNRETARAAAIVLLANEIAYKIDDGEEVVVNVSGKEVTISKRYR